MTRGLLFDLDGTLYLSTPILHSCYVEGIEQFNREEKADVRVPTEAEVLAQVGNPIDEIYANLFPGLDPDYCGPLSRRIVTILLEKIRDKQGQLVDGVHEVLGELAADYRLGMVTNAQRAYLEAVVETYELGKYFDKQLCIEDVDSEDKAVLIERQLEFFDYAPAEVVMVGDRTSDQKAARQVGTGFVACLYGHADRTELDSSPSVTSFSELPGLIKELRADQGNGKIRQ